MVFTYRLTPPATGCREEGGVSGPEGPTLQPIGCLAAWVVASSLAKRRPARMIQAPNLQKKERRKMIDDETILSTALKALDGEQRAVMKGIADGWTEPAIGLLLGLGRDRVHQVKRTATARMRKAVAELGLKVTA